MSCPTCHAANPPGAKYCNQCGAALSAGCAGCGHTNPPGSRFCNECGAALSGARAAVASVAPAGEVFPATALPPSGAVVGVMPHDGSRPLAGSTVLAGERKQVTVMFADVTGFTSLSEKFDPEDMHTIMNRCFELLVQEVHRYEGTINQFTGDGIMALFGAPVARTDSPQRAVLAALSIQNALEDLAAELQRERGISFRMRIGVNTGMAVVGAVGSERRADYTAVGNTTNLAARMEQMAEPGTILISESTYRLVHDEFECESLGVREVKGKADPVAVYRVIGLAAGHRHDALSGQARLTPFTGRDEELRVLRKHVDRALNGETRVIGIMAETGAGKSRLVHELIAGLDRRRLAVAVGHCLSYGAGVAYMPFFDMLRDLQPCAEDAECAGGALYDLLGQGKVLPPEGAGLGLRGLTAGPAGNGDGADGLSAKHTVFRHMLDALFEASERAPLVLVIEDLQWIDPVSEELLGDLIRGMGGKRICLICTFTPGYRFPWADRSYYRHITLDPLSRDSSAEMVRSLLGGLRVPPELMDLLQDGAEGNPYYLEASVRVLEDDGFIEQSPEGVRIARSLAEAHIPDTVQDIVMAKIDRLAEPVKRTLQVAAIIGRVFEEDLLAAVLESEGITPQLSALAAAELITSRGPNLCAFRQGVTRDVAYQSLLRGQRQELHLRVARAMTWLYGDRLHDYYARLGQHFAAGGEAEAAIRYLRLGAQASAMLGAMQDGAEQVEQALRLLGDLPDSTAPERLHVDLLMDAAELRFMAGAWPESATLWTEALEKAKAIDYREKLGALYLNVGGLGRVGAIEGEDALSMLKKGLQLCEEAGEEVPLARGYLYLGNALRAVGQWAGAADCYRKQIDIGERFPETRGDVVGRSFLALTALDTGRVAEALAHAQAALEAGRVVGNDWSVGFTAAFTSDVFLEAGEYDEAERLAGIGLDIGERLGVGFETSSALCTLGRVAFARGDYRQALKFFKRYLGDAPAGGFGFAARVRLGEAALALGRVMQAYGYASDALECNPSIKDIGRGWRLLAAVLMNHRPPDLEQAQEFIQRAVSRYQELEMPVELGSSLGVEAALARLVGDDDGAEERLARARAILDAAGATWRLEELQLRIAQAQNAPASVL